MRLTPKKSLVNLCFCLILLGVIGWALWAEYDRPWKSYQRAFTKLDAELTVAELSKLQKGPLGEEEKKRIELLEGRQQNIAQKRPKIQQLWLKDFNIADRCMTCHQGVEYARFAKADEPYRTHPGKYLDPERHPVEKFGCVSCHDGQGMALETEAAHGEVENWLSPLLRGHFAEASCTACHPMRSDIPAEAVLEEAPVFSKARTLYLTNHCRGCHVLEGFQRPERIGPILTNIAAKTRASWIDYWLTKPKDYLPKTKMPDFELKKQEILEITAYLLSLKSSLPSNSKARALLGDPKAQTEGRKTLEDLGCLGCHKITDKGEDFAPDLSRVGEKASPDWIFDWVKDPKKYWPQTAMPNLRIEDEEAQQLVAYLSSLKRRGQIGETALSGLGGAEQVEKGEKLAKEKGCTGCHEISKFPLGFNAPEHNGIGEKRLEELVFAKTDIPHTLLAWLQTKVMKPRAFAVPEENIVTLMPVFGFSKEQGEALSTFLLSLRDRPVLSKYIKILHDPGSAQSRGELFVEYFNCLGCHKIGEKGGIIAPELSFEGSRVNPEWMVDFLQGPTKIRPEDTLPTRMPTFGLTAEQAETVAAYFTNRNKVTYPYYLTEKKDSIKKEDRDKAWGLYWKFFACHTCHSWKGRGGSIGPDQSGLSDRLRKEWIIEWLRNPQKFIPDARMPNFELYDDELVLLSDLIMSFKEVPPSVWDEMRRRWQDELLAKRAGEPPPSYRGQ